MELRNVEAFVETARQGNITRAAQSLFITQPALTIRLKSLEAELGDKLLARENTGVLLTDAGKAFLPHAQRMLLARDDGIAAIEHLREATAGNLYLGCAPLVSTYVLPTLLKQFASRHSKVHITVHTGHTEEVLAMVLNQHVHIGLCRRIKHENVRAVKVHEDQLVLVVHPNHPFGHREFVSVEEVAGEDMVLFDRTSSYNLQVRDIFTKAKVVPKETFELDNVEAAKKIVEQGMGIALLPHITILRELSLGTVKAVPIADSPLVKRDTVAIYRHSMEPGGITKAFLDVASHFSHYLEKGLLIQSGIPNLEPGQI
jgi:DNA-binding transcriptional LysR family regulator